LEDVEDVEGVEGMVGVEGVEGMVGVVGVEPKTWCFIPRWREYQPQTGMEVTVNTGGPMTLR
jgi:hypothetical protein